MTVATMTSGSISLVWRRARSEMHGTKAQQRMRKNSLLVVFARYTNGLLVKCLLVMRNGTGEGTSSSGSTMPSLRKSRPRLALSYDERTMRRLKKLAGL
jgi:hypothetical protein